MAKSRQGKLSKGQKAVFIIVAVVLVLAIAFIGVWFGFLNITVNVYKPEVEAGAKPAYAATSGMTALLSTYSTEVDSIKKGTEISDIAKLKEMALAFLDVASDSRRNVDKVDNFLSFNYSDGSGSASSAGIEGEMIIRGFSLNLGANSYSQSGGPVVKAGGLTGAAQAILDQLSRTATLNGGRDYIQQKGTGSKASNPDPALESFPYMKTNFSKLANYKYSIDQWMIKDNILVGPGEVSNFDFNAIALKDDVSISYAEDETTRAGVWTVSFKLNCPELDELKSYNAENGTNYANYVEYAKGILGEEAYAEYEAVVEKARAGTREGAGSEDLEYRRYDLTMEIWDNGYIRTMTSEESWAASIKVAGINLQSYTNSSNTNSYYYSSEEIMALVNANADWAEFTTPYEFMALMTGATYDEASKTWTEGGWTAGYSTDMNKASPKVDLGEATYTFFDK